MPSRRNGTASTLEAVASERGWVGRGGHGGGGVGEVGGPEIWAVDGLTCRINTWIQKKPHGGLGSFQTPRNFLSRRLGHHILTTMNHRGKEQDGMGEGEREIETGDSMAG